MKKTLTLLTIAFGLAATLQAQSLADFARQERARKKNAETRIVITNETLNAGKAPSPTSSPATEPAEAPKTEQAGPAAPAIVPAKSPTDLNGRGEASWRAAFAKAREDLKRAEDQLKALELKLNQLNRDFLIRSDVYNKEQQFSVEINAANAQLVTARKNVELDKQKISQLEDDLRRAGGPAGWGR